MNRIVAGSVVKASLDLNLSLAKIKRNCRGVVKDVMNDNILVEFVGVDNPVIIPESFVDLCADATGTALSANAPAVGGEGERYRDLYIQASGTLAIVAAWLRGTETDLTAQDLYDMIAKEQGLPAEMIES